MIHLHSADWTADVRPEIGGAIASLRHRGQDILRTMPAASTTPLDAACFPLARVRTRPQQVPRAGTLMRCARSIPGPPPACGRG